MAKKILIVDDEQDILDLAVVRLKKTGYEIIPAIDAEQALVILQADTCDLILLDLFLPRMQGDELCRKLKNDDKFKSIPIIIFTAGNISSKFSRELLEMRADDCITKPFEPQELLSKIKKFIG